MSGRARGNDGKHKRFNNKDKFKRLWVTYSGMGPGGYCVPSWCEPSPANHCMTLDKAQFGHLYNGS